VKVPGETLKREKKFPKWEIKGWEAFGTQIGGSTKFGQEKWPPNLGVKSINPPGKKV